MAFLGFTTLVSIAAAHLDRPRAAFVAVLLFVLAAAPTAAIVLVRGNPFQHPAAVTPKPLEAVFQVLQQVKVFLRPMIRMLCSVGPGRKLTRVFNLSASFLGSGIEVITTEMVRHRETNFKRPAPR